MKYLSFFMALFLAVTSIAMDNGAKPMPPGVREKLIAVGKTMDYYALKSKTIAAREREAGRGIHSLCDKAQHGVVTKKHYIDMGLAVNRLAKNLWNTEDECAMETNETFKKYGDDGAPYNIGFLATQGVGDSVTQFCEVTNSANFVPDALELLAIDPETIETDEDRYLYWGIYARVINKVTMFPVRQYLKNYIAYCTDDGSKIGPITESERRIFGVFRNEDENGLCCRKIDDEGNVFYSRELSKEGKAALKKYTQPPVAAKWNLALNLDLVNEGNFSLEEISQIRQLKYAIGYSPCKYAGRVFRGSCTSGLELAIMFAKGQFFYLPGFISTSRQKESAYWNPIVDDGYVLKGNHNLFLEIDTSEFFDYSCVLQDTESYYPEENECVFSCNNLYSWKGIRFERNAVGKIDQVILELKTANHYSYHDSGMKTVSETIAKLDLDKWLKQRGELVRTKRVSSQILANHFIQLIASLYKYVLQDTIKVEMVNSGSVTPDQWRDFVLYKQWLKTQVTEIFKDPMFIHTAGNGSNKQKAEIFLHKELEFSTDEAREIARHWDVY